MGEKITYVADSAPAFSTNLRVGEERRRIQFENKQLVLDVDEDAELIAALDHMIKTRVQFSQVIRKLDPASAEKLAQAHKELVQKQNAGHTGPASSQNDLALQARMEEEKQRYLSQGISDEEASQLVHDVMKEQTVAVEKVANPVVQEVPKVGEAAEDGAKPNEVFANLGGEK